MPARNLYGEIITPHERGIYLYADECKPNETSRWLYMIILAIPEEKWEGAYRTLMKERGDYSGEIHFTKIGKGGSNRIDISLRWLRAVLADQNFVFNFHVLGIDMSKLNKKAFGSNKRRIYNRFFRSAVLRTLTYFFGKDVRVRINAIYHDRSEMENDEYFDWHLFWNINRNSDNVIFDVNKIVFIDSDHNQETRHPKHSQLIQLADLVLGATRQCIECSSNNYCKIEVAKEMIPLLERIMDERKQRNPNSRYSHFRRCSISFFPKEQLNSSQLASVWERARSGFFSARPLLLKEKLSRNQTLPYG